MNGSPYGGAPVRSLSLAQIEEELARTERTLAAHRASMKQSHSASSADAAALHSMGQRAKEIMNRAKTWRGGPKRSDSAELDALRAEMKLKSDTINRLMEDMKIKSEQARELDKRQQALSTRRTELMNQGG